MSLGVSSCTYAGFAARCGGSRATRGRWVFSLPRFHSITRRGQHVPFYPCAFLGPAARAVRQTALAWPAFRRGYWRVTEQAVFEAALAFSATISYWVSGAAFHAS